MIHYSRYVERQTSFHWLRFYRFIIVHVTKIEVKDLPEAVTQAITKSYEDATIKEAYVAEKETGKVYKVIITTKDAQEVTVLLNEKGEEVKEIK